VPDAAPDTVVLRDGTQAVLRPVQAADRPALHALFAAMSPVNRHRRFFTAAVSPEAMARWAAEPQPGTRGLVAIRDGRLVAHAAAVPTDAGVVEVAFAVTDELHGIGLGTALLLRLAGWAAHAGHGTLRADVLPSNAEMLEVLEHAGPASVAREDGVLHVDLPATLPGP
jgi:acetyltransferase